jgi:hypothetical protein
MALSLFDTIYDMLLGVGAILLRGVVLDYYSFVVNMKILRINLRTFVFGE